ncbi:MAG: hypothetical protein MUC35_02470 [Candidatus Margulisbacteria bacterium]|jgi:copper chaperone CopZ|nr:hypothetical protein [Candidatus Margulisiibacteriota bacterium]
MKKLLSLLLLTVFLLTLVPFTGGWAAPAEAKAKKRIVRKAKKKVRRPIKKKKARLVKKRRAVAKPVKKKYNVPVQAGPISQQYSLEEGVNDSEADRIVNELRALGVKDASIDVNTNTLSVDYDSAELSSVSIIQKLKGLGYTVKRIN